MPVRVGTSRRSCQRRPSGRFSRLLHGQVAQDEAARKQRVGCVDGYWDPSLCERRGVSGVGAQAGPSNKGTQFRARSCSRRGLSFDRGGQGPGDRVGYFAPKSRLGPNGVIPARVPAEAKQLILDTVDDATAAGLAHRWAASLWGAGDDRVHRWRTRRRQSGSLVDRRPGGAAVHTLLAGEVEEILEIAEQWGPVDRSHRKLAHRGSYQHRVWVSPSTFRRVLAAHGLIVPQAPPRRREPKRPWPHWLVSEPNRIRISDVTGFSPARRCVFAIVDMAGRRQIATLVSAEESSSQVVVVFDQALGVEGLVESLTDERLDLALDDPRRPILLAVSDNGPPMVSADTRAFMAAVAIAQHHPRPSTPTDQARIESFFGHTKTEWPHLDDIAGPNLLETELRRIRSEYNNVRLHQAIGYATPNDEHYHRGQAIRDARRQGLQQARQTRLDHNRRTHLNNPEKTK